MCTAVKWLTYLDSLHPGLPGLGLRRDGGIAKWEREGGDEKSAVMTTAVKWLFVGLIFSGTWIWETLMGG